MNMKRVGVSFVISLAVFICLMSFVSAQDSITDFFSSVGQGVSDLFFPFFSQLLGATTGEAALSKILLFLLLWLIVDAVIANIEVFERYWIHVSISFIVSVLSIRFLASESIVTAILLPYGALGVAMTSLLPVIIFAYFIQSFDNTVIRRLGYIVFAVIFVGLWWVRRADIGDLGYFYLISVGILLLSFIFDGTVHGWIRRAKASIGIEKIKSEEVNILKSRIKQLQTALASETDNAERRKISGQIENAKRRLTDLTQA